MFKWKKGSVPVLFILCLFAGKVFATGEMRTLVARHQPRPIHQRLLAADSVRILALRVQFQKDTLPTSTGDGTFDLGTDAKKTIDPPPHNRSYFQNQLLALSNYYRQVSNGKLIISGTVYPEAENEAYQLPNDMRYYSGEGKETLVEMRWAELLRDALQIADQKDKINFASFQSVFVFHAGVGNDFAFDFDPTPFDIKSVFLDSVTLIKTLGSGISVQNGQHIITNGLILPETESQEGIEIGLLGTMTLLFGAQLGLPSLNDTDNQRPGIGRWGLMDQGSANLQGLVPAEPCAWSKVFLGWVEPVKVSDGNDLRVAIGSAKESNKIYRIPINANEYFLIENRQRDPDKDGKIVGWDANGSKVELHEDPKTGATRLLFASTPAVITRWNPGSYDFGLPGSGILIWHIDENVIRANIAENRVNANREHRGVDLVECDGAQDIGYFFGFFSAAAGAENGDYWDPYWAGNQSHKEVNESETVELSTFTLPNSNANDGSITHIQFFNFSDQDSIMTFSVRSGLKQAGFPQSIDGAAGATAILVSPVQSQSTEKMIVLGKQNGVILAWQGDGNPLLAGQPGRTVPAGFFAATGQALTSKPIVAQLDEEPDYEILAAASNKLWAWKTRDQDGDGSADPLFVLEATGNISADLIALALPKTDKQQIAFATHDGQLNLVYWDGGKIVSAGKLTSEGDALTGLALADLNLPRFLVTANSGRVFLADFASGKLEKLAEAAGLPRLPVVLNMRNTSGPDQIWYSQRERTDLGILEVYQSDGMKIFSNSPQNLSLNNPAGFVAGDPDADGLPELVTVMNGNLISLEGGTLNVTGNFPIRLGDFPDWSAVPIIYDVDGDGSQEAVTITPGGQIVAYDGQGKMAAGFPLSIGAASAAVPALADLDNDSDIELIVAADDGFIYVYDLPALDKTDPLATLQYGGDPFHTGMIQIQPSPVAKNSGFLPESSVYCYPNPSEDGLIYIRYKLGRDADAVQIKIYDLSGELVHSFAARGLSAVSDHEERWDASVASGVYFVRIEAVRNGEKTVAFTKAAIVR